jgi:hypothetical protein
MQVEKAIKNRKVTPLLENNKETGYIAMLFEVLTTLKEFLSRNLYSQSGNCLKIQGKIFNTTSCRTFICTKKTLGNSDIILPSLNYSKLL